MFSNDRNIETIGQLVEATKHYLGLQREYMKLDGIEKVVRLITALILVAVLSLLVLLILIYLSFAAAYALQRVVARLGLSSSLLPSTCSASCCCWLSERSG